MSPNNIYAAWEEERENIRVMLRDWPFYKAAKTALIRRLRTLETLLDKKPRRYNTTEFTNWVNKK